MKNRLWGTVMVWSAAQHGTRWQVIKTQRHTPSPKGNGVPLDGFSKSNTQRRSWLLVLVSLLASKDWFVPERAASAKVMAINLGEYKNKVVAKPV